MSNEQLKETLIAVARTPDMFKRDTVLLLGSLEKVESIKKNLDCLSKSQMAKNQAE